MVDWLLPMLALVLAAAAVGALGGAALGVIGTGGGAVLAPALYLAFEALGRPVETAAHEAAATALGVIALLSVRAATGPGGDLFSTPPPRLFIAAAAVGGALGGGLAAMTPGPWLAAVLGLAGCATAAAWVAQRFGALLSGEGSVATGLRRHPAGAAALAAGAGVLARGGGWLWRPEDDASGRWVGRRRAAMLGAILAGSAAAAHALIGAGFGANDPVQLGSINLPALLAATLAAAAAAPVGARLREALGRALAGLGAALFLGLAGAILLRQALAAM